jgi:hypothetical protein
MNIYAVAKTAANVAAIHRLSGWQQKSLHIQLPPDG